MNLFRPLLVIAGLAMASAVLAQQDPHAGHHPLAPAPAGPMCGGMDMTAMKAMHQKMQAQMQEHMKAMRDWQQRMLAARGASERKALMAEHQKLLDEHQKMMDGCAGMMKDG